MEGDDSISISGDESMGVVLGSREFGKPDGEEKKAVVKHGKEEVTSAVALIDEEGITIAKLGEEEALPAAWLVEEMVVVKLSEEEAKSAAWLVEEVTAVLVLGKAKVVFVVWPIEEEDMNVAKLRRGSKID